MAPLQLCADDLRRVLTSSGGISDSLNVHQGVRFPTGLRRTADVDREGWVGEYPCQSRVSCEDVFDVVVRPRIFKKLNFLNGWVLAGLV